MELKDIIDLSPEGLMTDILDTRQTMLSWEDHIIELQREMTVFKKQMEERFDRVVGFIEKRLGEMAPPTDQSGTRYEGRGEWQSQ